MIVIWVELVRGDKVGLRPGQWDHWDDLLPTGPPDNRIIIICTRNNNQTTGTGQSRMVPGSLFIPANFLVSNLSKFCQNLCWQKLSEMGGNWSWEGRIFKRITCLVLLYQIRLFLSLTWRHSGRKVGRRRDVIRFPVDTHQADIGSFVCLGPGAWWRWGNIINVNKHQWIDSFSGQGTTGH